MENLAEQNEIEQEAEVQQSAAPYTLEEANVDARRLFKLGAKASKAAAMVDQDIAELEQEMQMLLDRRNEILEPMEAERERLKNNLIAYHQKAMRDNPKEKSIKLSYATLKSTLQGQDYSKDDEKLLDWVKKNSPEHVKVADPVVAWGELKKQVAVVEGKAVIKETGEVVEGLEPLARVIKYDVKLVQ